MSSKKKKKIEAKGKGTSTKGPVPTETQQQASSAHSQSPKPTTSFDIFEMCVQRARNLVKLHQAAHGRSGKPEPYASDAHRAAIVLAVSALDAFIRDFAISKTIELLAASSDPLPGPLKDRIKKFLKEDGLLDAARNDDLLEKVEKAFRADFERRSFQGTNNIEEQLKIVGYDNIFRDVAVDASMNEETLKGNLDQFTQRRHAIAHRGDYDLNENPPRENRATKKDAEDCIKLVCRIAKHMYELRSKK